MVGRAFVMRDLSAMPGTRAGTVRQSEALAYTMAYILMVLHFISACTTDDKEHLHLASHKIGS